MNTNYIPIAGAGKIILQLLAPNETGRADLPPNIDFASPTQPPNRKPPGVCDADHSPDESFKPTSAWIELKYRRLVWIAEHLLRYDRLRWTIESHDLVHTMYLQLIKRGEKLWASEAQFVGTCVVVMQHVLCDQSRARDAQKRGGDGQQ